MCRPVVTVWMLAVGCAAQPLRPAGLDPSKGTAVVALGPSADADRSDETAFAARSVGKAVDRCG